MNLTIQPLFKQNVASNSLRSKSLRIAAFALPIAAALALAGCKNDRFEKQNSDATTESQTNVENLTATRYNFDWDSTYLDAISYKVGNNEKELILDSAGNVDVEHTYKKDNNGNFIGYETIHHNSNGIGDLYAHRVVSDDINDSTRVTRSYDKDGGLIFKDSIILNKQNGKQIEKYTTFGDSKLLK